MTWICESCRRARATVLIEFPLSAQYPKGTYHGCAPCSSDLPEEAVVTAL